MRGILLFLPVMLLLLASMPSASASHGGGTSGGCSGDCTPPTLGTDNDGNQVVRGGFAINGMVFDVDNFKQDIPTQTASPGKPVTVTLTIFENTDPQSLEHVSLMLGLENKMISGVMVQSHPVQIAWERAPGEARVNTTDPGGLIKDVSVTEEISQGNNIMTFAFTPTKVFDTETMLVRMWDMERNTWTNYFYGAIELVSEPKAEGSIPEWVKINAAWWAEGQITDDTFIQAMQHLIESDIIVIQATEHAPDAEPDIPEWVKINAAWWAEGQITDDTFIQAMQHLISAGIIKVQSTN